jgi:hypothetical protein
MPVTCLCSSRQAGPALPPSRASRGLRAVRVLTACLALALDPAILDGAALAATSETCLRRCLTTCAEPGRAAQGEVEACLRPCLKACPVHCGTVDTDCALDFLKRAPAFTAAEAPEPSGEPWEASSGRGRVAVLVGRCAEACVVKPDCRPSAYDHGPSELTPATPPPHSGQRAK